MEIKNEDKNFYPYFNEDKGRGGGMCSVSFPTF